jgi:sterol desaturase/sphingolipid hydroxylase (fatty acid hydroxylase superfamily)
MSPIVYAIPVFLALVALEWLIARRRGLAIYRVQDAITSLNIGVISETIRSLVKLLTVVVYALVVERVGAFTWDLKNPLVWVLAFVLYDFFYYWAHRCGHEVNLMWAAHVVHHSSEDFNLSTALRQSSTNQFFYWLFYLPMAVIGIPVSVFVVVALVSMGYQFWVHTQLVGKLGWMEKFFATPSNHRVHHGRNDYCIDRNYGGTFIIWDRMFGTFAEERDNEPVVYGVKTPLASWNPLWGNLKNYATLWRDLRATPGMSNKLMRVFAPPDWRPEAPSGAQAGNPETAPAASLARARFDTPVLPWQQRYGQFACLMVFVLLFNLLILTPGLSVPQRAAYAVLIILNAVGIAWVFEGQARAVSFELVRAVLVFGALAAGLWFAPVGLLAQVAALLALLVSVVLLLKVRAERVAAQPSLAGVTA